MARNGRTRPEPPFGYSLSSLRSVAPPDISTATVFRSALPFICLQAVGVGLCIIFASIVVWPPKVVYADN